jgi:predicted DCC family thiol-disulfide oxidoreductase YuxK
MSYPKASNYQLSVYFDGLCPLCSREIEHYRKKDIDQQIQFVDISVPQFDARAEGLDPDKVHERFHVKTKEGTIVDGVDAFRQIWQTLGIFKPLSWAAQSRWLRPPMDLGYVIFAKIRPFFRRKQSCDTGYCQRT